MNAQEILTEIRCLGGRLEIRGERLYVEAPKGTLSPALKAALAERKADLLVALSGGNLDDWARLPLSAIEERRVALKICSDEYGDLWLVSTEAERNLADERQPTYTVAEARRMIGLPQPLVRQIHNFKQKFGGILELLEQAATATRQGSDLQNCADPQATDLKPRH